jgi:hypothetical protein
MSPIKIAILACGLLAACDQTPPIVVEDNLPLDDPRQQALVMSECAIYYAAVAKLESDGLSADGNPTKDCPVEARARSADINPMVSVPSVTPGYPETLYQRMIARGIPADLAADIAKSKAFWDLVAQRDSAYANF